MKKVLACILTMMMLLSVMPMSLLAHALNETKFIVESADAFPGDVFSVRVSLENNPGIVSANINVAFDDNLTLIGAVKGDVFPAYISYIPPKQLSTIGRIKTSCNFAWSGADIDAEDIKDGTLITLQFEVSDEAQINDVYHITVSARNSDIVDKDSHAVIMSPVVGEVTIIDYIPGDVDDSGEINMLDTLLLNRYIVDGCKYDQDGYAVQLNENAANVNDDDVISMLDVLLINRYIVDGCKYDPDGYGVRLIHVTKKCLHETEMVAEVEATCEAEGNCAYWHCTKCGLYFLDETCNTIISLEDTVIPAKGHNPENVAAIPATMESVGYTAGVWCTNCQQWLSGHEEYGPLAPTESNINYHLFYVREENESTGSVTIKEDQYLKTLAIDNPYPNTYIEGTGLNLDDPEKKVTAAGYDFLGWYARPEVGASRIYEIGADEQGSKSVYAIWKKHVYTITYLQDSPGSTLPLVEGREFTADKVTALDPPSDWPNLVWVGWSDEDGNIIKSIPKGTDHDVVLTANWMSKRNQTVPNQNYAASDPIIVENFEAGYCTFTYEIGDIQNVPIQAVEASENPIEGKGYNLVKGQTHAVSATITKNIAESEAQTVSDTIANATTKSDSWTLSEDWNKSTSFSQEHSNERTSEEIQKAALSFAESNKYTISSGTGSTTEHIDETGKSTKVTTNHELGVNVNAKVNVGSKAKIEGVKKEAEVSNGYEYGVGVSYKYGHEKTKEEYEKHTDKTSAYWNVNAGFEAARSFTASNEITNSLKQSESFTEKYGETLDIGGSQSNTVSSSNTQSQEHEYSSAITYSTETGSSITVDEVLTGEADTGWYRKVLTASFRVFAVVIYDIKTSTFSVITYSLKINDSERLFTDYSTVPSFDDYENGVLPFSVPYAVTEYVYNAVGMSEGLKFDNGIVINYGYKNEADGICYKSYNTATDVYSDPCNTAVVIPQYYVDNVDNYTKIIKKVVGISANAFKGTNVTSVCLNSGITEIPDSAFEDCADLLFVTGPNVTAIGNSAFKNCPSLIEMSIPTQVTSLGLDAFDGDEGFSIEVASGEVFDAALTSDVKNMTLDVSFMSGTLDGKTIDISDEFDYFYLNGGGRQFSNLLIESDAQTTGLNNITITSDNGCPVNITSENLLLGFVSIESNGWTMKLGADTTTVTLNGNNYITSSSEYAVLSKSLILTEKEGSVSSGRMRIAGNVFVFGTVRGVQCAVFDSAAHVFRYLTEEEYNHYANGVTITLCFGNGSDNETETKYYGVALGDLPIPTKENFIFVGWFTEEDGGTEVTAQTILTDSVGTTLYAHWIEAAYNISWSEGEGYSITVIRTSSPNANATTGELENGDTIYYGDVLSITYTPDEGYSISDCGEESITVTGDVTGSTIYASAYANSYTYNVVYKSINGTALGTSTETYCFGTMNTIVPISISGYNTPGSQEVIWDSVEAKTITFLYTPTSVGKLTKTGNWVEDGAGHWMEGYKAEFEQVGRTANSVQIKVTWTDTIYARNPQTSQYYIDPFGYAFSVHNSGQIVVVTRGKWSSPSSSDRSEIKSTTITVTGIDAGTTEVSLVCKQYQFDANGVTATESSEPGTVKVPITKF